MSLSRRLSLILGTVVAAIVVLVVFTSVLLAQSSLRGSVDELLTEQADSLSLRLAAGPRLVRPTQSDELPVPLTVPSGAAGQSRFEERAIRVQFLNLDGSIVFGADDIPVYPAVIAAATSGDVFRIESIDGRSFRILTRQHGEQILQMATDVESIESGLADLRRALIAAAIVGVASAGLVGAIVARRFTRPIVEVAAATDMLAKNAGLPNPIPMNRRDEIGHLARSFNELVGALRQSHEQQARLVADTSHELRTPLTSLRMKVEFLQLEPVIPAAQRRAVISAAALELESLGELVNELVDLAANTSIDEVPVLTNLGELVEQTTARARITTQRTITVSAGGTQAVVRPTLVRRALSNLIDNAKKYSPEGTPIRVRELDGAIEVEDRGPGVGQADRGRVFDRFYRGASSHGVSGSGIGLAIVAQVAEVHDGSVWVRDSDDGGAIVGFSIGERRSPS